MPVPPLTALSSSDQARKNLINSILGVFAPATAPPPAATAPSVFPQPASTPTALPGAQPQPVKPLSAVPQPPSPAAATQDALLAQSQFVDAHPGVEGTAPPTFTPETGRHALLRGIFSGMSEFGRPGAGFAQNKTWDETQQAKEQESRNWPLQREKNIQAGMDTEQERELKTAQVGALNATTQKNASDAGTVDELAARLVSKAQASGDQMQINHAMEMADRLKSMGKTPGKWTLQRDPAGNVIGAQSPEGQIMPLTDPNVPQGLLQVAGQNETKPAAASPAALAGLQAGPQPKTAVYEGKTYPSVEEAQKAWAAKAQQIYLSGQEDIATARGKAFGDFKNLEIIDPNDGQVKTVYAKTAIASGAPTAAAGVPLMSKEAQINDIEFASTQARDAIEHLQPLDADSIATLTMAMRESDPTIFERLKDTMLGSQQLKPEQKAFVRWIAQLNERAMSLRNIAGMGQGSDTMRAALLNVLPSIKSGDKGQMLAQLDAFDNQVRILKGGIPTVKHPAAPQVPAKGTFAWDPQGQRHQADGTTPLPQGWSLNKPGVQ